MFLSKKNDLLLQAVFFLLSMLQRAFNYELLKAVTCSFLLLAMLSTILSTCKFCSGID